VHLVAVEVAEGCPGRLQQAGDAAQQRVGLPPLLAGHQWLPEEDYADQPVHHPERPAATE
jgi:hypothetical protein